MKARLPYVPPGWKIVLGTPSAVADHQWLLPSPSYVYGIICGDEKKEAKQCQEINTESYRHLPRGECPIYAGCTGYCGRVRNTTTGTRTAARVPASPRQSEKQRQGRAGANQSPFHTKREPWKPIHECSLIAQQQVACNTHIFLVCVQISFDDTTN